jgi:alpha-1,3-rhamnosyltransferase
MDNEKQVITVSVTAYNSSRYILETLESIKNQTYPNIILQIADDFSTDDTVEVCRKWIELNKARFVDTRIIVPEKNTGVSANCNRAWNACNTEWFKGIAGDDLLLPNCLEDNMQYVKNNPDAVFVFRKVQPFGLSQKQNDVIGRLFDYNLFELSISDQLEHIMTKGNFIPASTAFVNIMKIRDLGISHDERIPLLEDMPKWINVLRKNIKLHFFNQTTVKYRIHESSISTQRIHSPHFRRSLQLFWYYYIFDEIYKTDPEKAVNMAVDKYIGIYEFEYNIRTNKLYDAYNRIKPFLTFPKKIRLFAM